MAASINAAERPSRLSVVTHIFVVAILAASFVSGATLWYGQNAMNDSGVEPFNLHNLRIFHGLLNPFLCALFGFLVCQHIRLGWKMKANRLSGFFMEAVFAILILTGAGMYYSPEEWQKSFITIHHFTGLLLPLSLTIHWITAQVWIKKLSK